MRASRVDEERRRLGEQEADQTCSRIPDDDDADDDGDAIRRCDGQCQVYNRFAMGN